MKLKNRYGNIYLMLIVLGFFVSSCQKVINIDLNSASPQIVIQGNLSNVTTHDTVQISQTINFSDPNIFPAISGASVIINDNAGNIDTLFESPSGIYSSPKITGVPGRTYNLTINANGKIYNSTSTMPLPVNIDTLIVQSAPFRRGALAVSVVFKDPPGIANYYRFIEIINDTVNQRNYLTSDQLQDGKTISFTLISESNLKPGDSVTVMLESINEGVYKYFSSLNNAGGSISSVAPANPASNINNGALGYFNAYSVTSKSILAQ